MKHEDIPKPSPFTLTKEDLEAAIAAAPDFVDDPDCPYDPNNDAEVDEYWAEATLTHPGEHPHQPGFKGFKRTMPRTTAQKMFVKNYKAIAVINAEGHNQPIVADLPQEMIDISGQPVDFVLMFAGSQQELEDVLPLAITRMTPNGVLWIAYVKGTSKNKSDVHRDTIREYAETVGLTTVSLISVDDDWSALRLKHSE
jgi:hypothetical protein